MPRGGIPTPIAEALPRHRGQEKGRGTSLPSPVSETSEVTLKLYPAENPLPEGGVRSIRRHPHPHDLDHEGGVGKRQPCGYCLDHGEPREAAESPVTASEGAGRGERRSLYLWCRLRRIQRKAYVS